MKIFVFGNSIVNSDSIPTKLIPALSKKFPEIQFIRADPTENWCQEKELVILDTVVGISEVTLFNTLEAFEKQSRVTQHDYDLYMDLQLLEKIGKVKKVRIIGIPATKSSEVILQVINTVQKL